MLIITAVNVELRMPIIWLIFAWNMFVEFWRKKLKCCCTEYKAAVSLCVTDAVIMHIREQMYPTGGSEDKVRASGIDDIVGIVTFVTDSNFL